jgi:N-acetyl-anhydromuramyl-L-alanine amidase AmpD
MVADDGTIYQCNTLQTVSYHTAGVNTPSVGICFLGNYTADVPPAAQIQAGAHLVAWLMQELNLALSSVKGHRELGDSICPGNQWLGGKKWKRTLTDEIARAQQQAAGSGAEDAKGGLVGGNDRQGLGLKEMNISSPAFIKANHS